MIASFRELVAAPSVADPIIVSSTAPSVAPWRNLLGTLPYRSSHTAPHRGGSLPHCRGGYHGGLHGGRHHGGMLRARAGSR